MEPLWFADKLTAGIDVKKEADLAICRVLDDTLDAPLLNAFLDCVQCSGILWTTFGYRAQSVHVKLECRCQEVPQCAALARQVASRSSFKEADVLEHLLAGKRFPLYVTAEPLAPQTLDAWLACVHRRDQLQLRFCSRIMVDGAPQAFWKQTLEDAYGFVQELDPPGTGAQQADIDLKTCPTLGTA